MSQRKFLFDLNGKTKPVSGSYFEDSDNSTVLKNVTVNNILLPLNNGLVYVSGSTLSGSVTPQDGRVVSWNTSKGDWDFVATNYTDVVAANSVPPAGSDVTGTFNNISVRSLSNVNKGNPLQVSNGGTGLSASAFPVGESLLVGNGTNPFTFVTASNSASKLALLSTPTGWTLSEDVKVPSSTTDVEVNIYTTPGSYVWNKPAGTKHVRVLVQGAGGGGASGGNRSNGAAALGGGGGAAGAFAESSFFIDTDSASIVVGAGGNGGLVPNTGSSGIVGGTGGASSFSAANSTLLSANGGTGGSSGAGGAAVSATNIIYDIVSYNTPKLTVTSNAGGGSSTDGVSSTFTTASTLYYSGGGGGGGGSLVASNYITNYAGGNGGVSIVNRGLTTSLNATNAVSASISNILNISDPLFVFSGGGGGASAKFTGSINDFYKIEEPISSSAVFVLDGLLDYYGQYTREMINNITINRVGNSSIVTTNHLGLDSGSFYFNPTTTTNGLNFSINKNIGTGDFTIEFWVYITNTTNTHYIFDMRDNVSDGKNAIIVINPTSTTFGIYGNIGGGVTSLSSVSVNTWTHLAFVRQSGVVYLYKNGILDNSGAFTNRLDNNTAVTNWIGYSGFSVASGRILAGYLDRIRIYRSAIYTGNFTPSTLLYKNHNPQYVLGGIGSDGAYGSGGGGGGASTNYTSSNLTTYDTQTVSLVHSNLSQGSFKDVSIYNNTLKNNYARLISTSSANIQNINSLFPDGVLSSSYFAQGTTDNNVYITSNTSITDNFTVESWFYLTNAGSSGDANFTNTLLFAGYNPSPANGLLTGLSGSNRQLVVWCANGTNAAIQGGNTTLNFALNQWNHVAMQKSGTSVTFYLNGTSSTLTPTYTPTVTNNQFGYGLGNSIYSNYSPTGFAKEFVVTNRVKSAQEIQDYYNAVISDQSGSYADPGLNGVRQGGNGGDGYVAVISYKY